MLSMPSVVANRGGFPILRHNELRNITASMLSQVCPNVSVEPHLQPLVVYVTDNYDLSLL